MSVSNVEQVDHCFVSQVKTTVNAAGRFGVQVASSLVHPKNCAKPQRVHFDRAGQLPYLFSFLLFLLRHIFQQRQLPSLFSFLCFFFTISFNNVAFFVVVWTRLFLSGVCSSSLPLSLSDYSPLFHACLDWMVDVWRFVSGLLTPCRRVFGLDGGCVAVVCFRFAAAASPGRVSRLERGAGSRRHQTRRSPFCRR